MRYISDRLFQSITNQFQIDSHGRQPTQYVLVKNRFWNRAVPEFSDFQVEWARLPNVISIDTDETVETPAKSFTITVENKDGLFSPDYAPNKRPRSFVWRGNGDSAWWRQLFPNTELQIHFGYGDQIMKTLTGYIDNVRVNAEAQTITITGRSKYKKAITNTIIPPDGKEYLVERTDINIYHAVKAFLEAAGLEVTGSAVDVPITGEPYLTGVKLGKRGQTYHDVVTEIMNTLFHTLSENAHGVIRFRHTPQYSRSDPQDFIVDDFLHLKELEYDYDDVDLYGRVLVRYNDRFVSGYTSGYIENELLLGDVRETEVEAPWANSPSKRHLAAKKTFTNMLYKFRRVSIAIPANPAIELWDVVGLREKISTATQRYTVRAIRTSFSAAGFFQILELTSNVGFSPTPVPPPPSDLPQIERKIGAGTMTISGSSGDKVTIYANGSMIAENVTLGESADYALTLKPGTNVIIVEGVSAGSTAGVAINIRFTDSAGVTTSAYPISFLRENVDEPSGYYNTRPRSVWVINGVT